MPVHLKDDWCPYCWHLLNGASAIESLEDPIPESPEPGDLSLCASCCRILVFDHGLKLRKPKPGELVKIFKADPEFAKNFQRTQSLLKIRNQLR